MVDDAGTERPGKVPPGSCTCAARSSPRATWATMRRAWIRDQVADHAVPPYVRIVDEIPLTPIGKVDGRALTAAVLEMLGAS